MQRAPIASCIRNTSANRSLENLRSDLWQEETSFRKPCSEVDARSLSTNPLRFVHVKAPSHPTSEFIRVSSWQTHVQRAASLHSECGPVKKHCSENQVLSSRINVSKSKASSSANLFISPHLRIHPREVTGGGPCIEVCWARLHHLIPQYRSSTANPCLTVRRLHPLVTVMVTRPASSAFSQFGRTFRHSSF